LVNTLATGGLLYAANPIFGIENSLIDCWMYGSLISATDPVSVLAILDEVQADSTLSYLVGGESTMNDAVSITLFGFFRQLSQEPDLQTIDTGTLVGLAIGQFFVIFLGGMAWGALIGFIAAGCSNFTGVLSNWEGLMTVAWALLASTLAEWTDMSGIVAIVVCAIFMRSWADKNYREVSRASTMALIKQLGLFSDLITFIFLGIVSLYAFLEVGPLFWDGAFIGIVVAVIVVMRAISVFTINGVANLFSNWNDRIQFRNSIIQFWSGLRGPVAFALAISIPETVPSRSVLIRYKKLYLYFFILKFCLRSTTIVVVWGSIFIIGFTTKPLLKILKVASSETESIPDREPGKGRLMTWMNRRLLRPLYKEEIRLVKQIQAHPTKFVTCGK
jgi:NhaP-type Na+/H+ or K+/H+ antiporter